MRTRATILGILLVATLSVAAGFPMRAQVDSAWIKAANNPALILLPKPEKTWQEMPSKKLKDENLVREDSLLRATRYLDSLRTAIEDSLIRAYSIADSLVAMAGDYEQNYDYSQAHDCYSKAIGVCPDSSLVNIFTGLRDRCASAFGMTREVYKPSVVARANFSADDFFLYYPLPEGSWHEVDGAPPVYYPGDEQVIYESRETSYSMVYPMVFGDRMYFSSRDLKGLGGYDIFCCEWDDNMGEWGEPKNLGFPYSSSDDDFLFVETEDGRYNIFASTRGCSPDSVHVYVTKREENPSLETVTGPSELRDLAQLAVNVDPSTIDAGESMGEDMAIDDWFELHQKKSDELRTAIDLLTTEEDPDQAESLRALIQSLREDLKDIEAHFLDEGSSFDKDRVFDEVNTKIAGVEGYYIFTRKHMGKKIKVIYE